MCPVVTKLSKKSFIFLSHHGTPRRALYLARETYGQKREEGRSYQHSGREDAPALYPLQRRSKRSKEGPGDGRPWVDKEMSRPLLVTVHNMAAIEKGRSP